MHIWGQDTVLAQEIFLLPGFRQQHHNWSLCYHTHSLIVHHFLLFARHHSRHLSHRSPLWPLLLHSSVKARKRFLKQIWSCSLPGITSLWAFHGSWESLKLFRTANKAVHSLILAQLVTGTGLMCTYLRSFSPILSRKYLRKCVFSSRAAWGDQLM